MADVQIRLRITDDDDLQAAHAVADDRPQVDLEEVAGDSDGGLNTAVEPVTAILIGAGALAAAQFIREWWEQRRGGLVIDQRPDAKDMIYRDRDVPYGVVLVFPADGGKVTVETKDAPKLATERLIESIISGVLKSASDVAEAAKEAVGADKVEEPVTG